MIRALVVASVLTLSSLANAAPNGTACTAPSECDSGNCVDKVCCNSACTGQCEACDVTGAAGTCTPVVGVAHASRTPCATSSDLCTDKMCDGVDRTKCAAFARGPETTCKAASCSGGTMAPAATCDGAGKCVEGAAVSCAPYACGGASCKTTCASSADCATGYSCTDGTCAPGGGACSADGLSAISTDGAILKCAPYRCFDGMCLAACAPGRDSDCQTGFVCDSNRNCVVPATVKKSDDDAGGCAYGSRGSGSVLALIALGLLGRLRARRAI